MAARLADPRLRGVAEAMEGVLDDLTARPDRLPLARRFLAVHLDGLERITSGWRPAPPRRRSCRPCWRNSAAPPGNCGQRLRHEETEALEIQVKVLSDRLREEGYR